MEIRTVETKPYLDQSFGTSGIRKKVSVVQQHHYIENIIQSVFNCFPDSQGETLVVGGDGRFYNDIAIQAILKIAIANHFGRIIVGQNGLLSTPASSHVIVKYKAMGGFILSASHNPGGPSGDFGIKFDNEHGAPSPKSITDKITEQTLQIDRFYWADIPDIDLSKIGEYHFGATIIQVISTTDDYVSYMQNIFDFYQLKQLFASGFSITFDAMNAITGPYAVQIFENILGASKGSVIHATPLPDFGGFHPEPNLTHAQTLVQLMNSDKATDIGVASDGDGDRYMIMGKNTFVHPADSLAILTQYLDIIPFYQGKMVGVARSMPTSFATDDVAKDKNIALYETPTGWKFFGSLLTDGKISLCGEESFGAGSSHLQEKDGIWAILCWLSIIAKTGKNVPELLSDLWQKHGRVFAQLQSFDLTKEAGESVMASLKDKLPSLINKSIRDEKITKAFVFNYQDPINHEITSNQGVCIFFSQEKRLVFRLSGTSSTGSTLRVYFNQRITDPTLFQKDVSETLSELIQIAWEISDLKRLTGVIKPTMIT